MRYVSPIALFLFCVFLMFAVASATGLTEIPTTQMKADVTKQIADREATLKRQGTVRAERRLKANKSTVPIDNQMAQTRRELEGLKQMKGKGASRADTAEVSDGLPKWLGESIAHGIQNPELLLYKLKTQRL